MPTLLTPLSALNPTVDASRSIQRRLSRVATAAGKFAVYAHALGPVGTHTVQMDFDSVESIDAFWDWYETVLGACEPFWLPSYRRDFVPLDTVGDADVSFDIVDRGYTDLEFPDPNRNSIVVVRADGGLTKRQIIDAVNNEDGTETLTMNASLGFEFTQGRANGICYLMYCRLTDDLVQMDWWTHDIASVTLSITEVRPAPLTGSDL